MVFGQKLKKYLKNKLKAMRTEIQKLAEQLKEKEKALKAEPFCVEIKLPSQSNIIRLSYSNSKNGKLIQVEELNAANEPISSSNIRGNSIKGNLPSMIVDLIPLFRCKPTDWMDHNPELYWDSYYKQH